ncbi:MtnX-like HAD-IB family phosphatase [Candidatus Acetothermia bacterium]|nr:MtnX-like HAD-IB family phosphatase [Candidatus Acetothermia bacterium]MBI3642857.1 MtnX-like HAD-IB family phosphatase [Candidatus Acetothermia bacterium]
MKRVIVFIDFDGTTAAESASNRLLDRFAIGDWRELDRKLDAKEISFRECVIGQFSMLSGRREEMIQFVQNEIHLRAGFKEFVNFCQDRKYDIHIVAEALDFMIEALFERESIKGVPIFSDRALFKTGQFSGLELRHFRSDCVCALGNCKGGHVRAHHDRYDFKIYIGDGTNDLCGARHSDFVFARRRLAELCKTQEIDYVPFEDFFIIQEELTQLGL